MKHLVWYGSESGKWWGYCVCGEKISSVNSIEEAKSVMEQHLKDVTGLKI